MGCKVPTDLVKISVKEATHMGFYHNRPQTMSEKANLGFHSESSLAMLFASDDISLNEW